jgi:hypothetical protein
VPGQRGPPTVARSRVAAEGKRGGAPAPRPPAGAASKQIIWYKNGTLYRHFLYQIIIRTIRLVKALSG